MRAVHITRFGGAEVLDAVDVAEPFPGDGQKLYDASTAGVNVADTHVQPARIRRRREPRLQRVGVVTVPAVGPCPRVGPPGEQAGQWDRAHPSDLG